MTAHAPIHVLLIEDDPELGAVTTEILKHLGYEMVWSASAGDGFQSLANSHRFDAVLLDLGLGSDNGVELIASLRERGRALPPLLIFSAQPIDALQQAANEIGAAAILQKPCAAADLVRALERVVRAADPARE